MIYKMAKNYGRKELFAAALVFVPVFTFKTVKGVSSAPF